MGRAESKFEKNGADFFGTQVSFPGGFPGFMYEKKVPNLQLTALDTPTRLAYMIL